MLLKNLGYFCLAVLATVSEINVEARPVHKPVGHTVLISEWHL